LKLLRLFLLLRVLVSLPGCLRVVALAGYQGRYAADQAATVAKGLIGRRKMTAKVGRRWSGRGRLDMIARVRIELTRWQFERCGRSNARHLIAADRERRRLLRLWRCGCVVFVGGLWLWLWRRCGSRHRGVGVHSAWHRRQVQRTRPGEQER
jgi:hypothetical protein